jgi:tyrosyl-tRNA synthetase
MFPLHAPEGVIRERVDGAFFDPELDIEENPVLDIARRFIFQRGENLHITTEYIDETYSSILELQEEVQNWADDDYEGTEEIHPQDVKTGVAEWLIEELRPVRDVFEEQPELLDPLEEI